jgi:RNA polymerase sigma factor (sigma-70 family)
MFQNVGRNEWILSGVVQISYRGGNSCLPFPVQKSIEMLGENIDSILAGLSSNCVESAWKTFLKSYSAMIVRVVCQYEKDTEQIDDCFLFVCEKLSDDGFRRLLQFDANRKAHFSTWLKLVVSNLCVDWHRKKFGRERPYRAILKLSAFDQLLYHYKIQCGMNRLASFRALQVNYPDLTQNQFTESNCRVHKALTSRQRWQLSIRKRETGYVIDGDGICNNSKETEPIETGPGPEKIAQFLQTHEALEQATSKLSHQQRLLLRLRYQEEMSLKDVADLAGLGDLHQAKRRIKEALAALADLLVSAQQTH